MWQQMMYQQAALAGGDSKNVDPAYMQQMHAYAQMMGALGVAADGTLLAGVWAAWLGTFQFDGTSYTILVLLSLFTHSDTLPGRFLSDIGKPLRSL